MIEDDPDFSKYLGDFLKDYDINITNYEDPFLGLSSGIDSYDLVILDLTLDGMDGVDVCKKIKKDYNKPVIISSARGDIEDKVVSFKSGADDFLPKPYDPKEMYIRILNLIKLYDKSQQKKDPQEIYKSSFSILDSEIYYQNRVLNLTKAEFEILSVLINSFGHVVSREHIVDSCDSLSTEFGKTLNTIIGRIRQKTTSDSIVAVRGIGYKLVK
jgi:two-component system OmpR family response regulator